MYSPETSKGTSVWEWGLVRTWTTVVTAGGGLPRAGLALYLHWQVGACRVTYRADWEPEAPSGKCMAGVPGVFWRCPAVLQGPSTHNSTWVPGKPHTSKNWPVFPICMWTWGGSAPSGQARVSRPNWPERTKSHAAWQSLPSRAENCGFSQKHFFILTVFSFW